MKTIRQIAEEIGVSKQRVYRHIKKRCINEVHQEQGVMYYDEAVETQIKQHFSKQAIPKDGQSETCPSTDEAYPDTCTPRFETCPFANEACFKVYTPEFETCPDTPKRTTRFKSEPCVFTNKSQEHTPSAPIKRVMEYLENKPSQNPYLVNAITEIRVQKIARKFGYSEVEVIETLVDWYYRSRLSQNGEFRGRISDF